MVEIHFNFSNLTSKLCCFERCIFFIRVCQLFMYVTASMVHCIHGSLKIFHKFFSFSDTFLVENYVLLMYPAYILSSGPEKAPGLSMWMHKSGMNIFFFVRCTPDIDQVPLFVLNTHHILTRHYVRHVNSVKLLFYVKSDTKAKEHTTSEIQEHRPASWYSVCACFNISEIEKSSV